MGIFCKRPLCLFCFCFIAASLLATVLGIWLKLGTILLFALLTALLLILSRKIKKRKYGLIEAAICTFFVLLAVTSSLLAVDLPIKRLEGYVSEGTPVAFVVSNKEYSSKYSTKYEGILLYTDKGAPKAKAYLTLDHEADYKAGDKLLLVGDISLCEYEESTLSLPRDVNLEITSTLDKDLIVDSRYEGFSLSITAARIREHIRDVFFGRLNAQSAALSIGVLTSDTSALSGEVIRDFRRSGVSHLLAVSGLHLAVIIGACEFLLMKLRVSKMLRCIILTVLSFFVICLSGFSLSALRSVLMLLVTYLCYALSREPDTLTSLSVAGALILLVSPVSVGSISFWLSFLATLGIILYSELISSIHFRRRNRKSRLMQILASLSRKLVGALTVTLSANVFICILLWAFFKETSVISPISNLSITPLGEAYLVLTLLVLVFGKIPFVGAFLCKITEALASVMLALSSRLSSLDFSVVSLSYAFAGIIITASSIALLTLFIIKLRDKRILFAVPTVAVAIFCCCLLVHNSINSHVKLAYSGEAGHDSVVISDGRTLSIIDVSDGSYSPFYSSYAWAKKNAYVEVESVVLTHYHEKHISSLDKFFRSVIANKVYLPAPENEGELLICKDIVALAKENGVLAEIYEKENLIAINDTSFIYLLDQSNDENSSKTNIRFLAGTNEGLLCYLSSPLTPEDENSPASAILGSADALIIGTHSKKEAEETISPKDYSGKVIRSTEEEILVEFSFDK